MPNNRGSHAHQLRFIFSPFSDALKINEEYPSDLSRFLFLLGRNQIEATRSAITCGSTATTSLKQSPCAPPHHPRR